MFRSSCGSVDEVEQLHVAVGVLDVLELRRCAGPSSCPWRCRRSRRTAVWPPGLARSAPAEQHRRSGYVAPLVAPLAFAAHDTPSSKPAGADVLAHARNVGTRSTLLVSRSMVPGTTPGPRDDQRHADRLLVEIALADEAVLAELVAVVGHQHDVGVREAAERRQLIDQRRDAGVDRPQRLARLAFRFCWAAAVPWRLRREPRRFADLVVRVEADGQRERLLRARSDVARRRDRRRPTTRSAARCTRLRGRRAARAGRRSMKLLARLVHTSVE